MLPCDVPNIKKETLKQLAACYETTGSLVIIRAGGRLQPLIGVYPVKYLPVFQQMLGAEEIFRGVDVRPGGPVMLHLYEGKPVLSLSGNPGGAQQAIWSFWEEKCWLQ